MAAESPQIPPALRNVKVLLFDTFGTVVDWRKNVKSRLQSLTADDWSRFAQEWRNSYGVFTRSFDPEVSEWKDIDTHHHESLIGLLHKWNLAGTFTDGEVKSLSLVWHRLTPWHDSVQGLEMLGRRFVTSTLSNGNQSLLQDLNEHGQLGFQRLISSADFKAYKPKPAVYLGAAGVLGLKPEECAMVAAHLEDLKAARDCGLKTIYVERPLEEAWPKGEQLYSESRSWVDLWVTEKEDGFVELARRLDIPK
ncbi:haloacid dehalogenase [Pseudomassariella vexata]|uniref:Haloacid dehalogenase n=1 Tax=Pseudomassariella vexata TaxID=1141098 RepID=A0A1Y2EBF0_9PEZI|nr:haloacid dehalogenase [Pseudomassariella vexata]ORY68737.1 haloacid dehalogenase [Pseudomassariella vexata]